MRTAADAFIAIDGIYTPQLAVDWVATEGSPSPLWVGHTLRLSADGAWHLHSGGDWKSLNEAAKVVQGAFKAAWDGEAEPGLYELIGPKLGKRGQVNPHGLTTPMLKRHSEVAEDERTDFEGDGPFPRNLFKLRDWLTATGHLGVLWTREGDHGSEFAAVRAAAMPQ